MSVSPLSSPFLKAVFTIPGIFCYLLLWDCHCVWESTIHLSIVKLLDQFGATVNNASVSIPEQDSWPTCAWCTRLYRAARTAESQSVHLWYPRPNRVFPKVLPQFALPSAEHGTTPFTLQCWHEPCSSGGQGWHFHLSVLGPTELTCRKIIHLCVHSWHSLTLTNPYQPIWYLKFPEDQLWEVLRSNACGQTCLENPFSSHSCSTCFSDTVDL